MIDAPLPQHPAVTTADAAAPRTALTDAVEPALGSHPLRLSKPALAIKIAIGIIAPLICALAVLGGMGSFTTVRDLAVPWFAGMAWIVPVGIDLGILALLAWDLLAEYLGLPWPVLRWTAWAFIAATIYLNIAGARGDRTASVMHAAMPVLFVIVIEGVRHLLRQWAGLAAGTRVEHVPLSRWLLAPRSSFLLTRRMVLWQVTSYQQALALEYQRLQTVARLQEIHGQYLWRWKAPLSERLALRLASAGPRDSAETADMAPPATSGSQPPADERDRLLVQKAAEILRDAERQGTRLSQTALARHLRAQGYAIANDRLGWLMAAVSSRERRGLTNWYRGREASV